MLRTAPFALLCCLAACTPAPGASGTRGIACGSALCEAGTAVCCVRPAPAAASCEARDGGCPLSAGNYLCDGPEDCATGLSCCGYSGRVGTFCGSGSCFAETLCHADADCPTNLANCCATGNGYRSCSASACP
ncbi:MAG TPA: hypothetical protein VGK67_26840 [Myxococcales bacterium]|jgi:hypothetical protein